MYHETLFRRIVYNGVAVDSNLRLCFGLHASCVTQLGDGADGDTHQSTTRVRSGSTDSRWSFVYV